MLLRRGNLSVHCRGLRGSSGLRRLASIFVLFKRARHGFDMSTEVDHRIEHLTVSQKL